MSRSSWLTAVSFFFQVGGFAGGQFPAFDAVGDAVLLVLFSVLNALAGYRFRGGRTLSHDWQRENGERCTEKRDLGGAVHVFSPMILRFVISHLHRGHVG